MLSQLPTAITAIHTDLVDDAPLRDLANHHTRHLCGNCAAQDGAHLNEPGDLTTAPVCLCSKKTLRGLSLKDQEGGTSLRVKLFFNTLHHQEKMARLLHIREYGNKSRAFYGLAFVGLRDKGSRPVPSLQQTFRLQRFLRTHDSRHGDSEVLRKSWYRG
jgi:hypothetical protein